ncbi:helix-turn-helix domain-containing protein [Pedobacter sp. MC2016-24]|uniref:helix-turn-helix domain-containing protein n=1 Tax=Pedobacter sp. MC2016-24 TaxID=2780090 RepID=UPI001880F789|nr:helix-turn-helix transcriptional regulator [Pedobacter sp. MC2016-24]MBE9598859.1 helix-turn-helix transcriptional regulator [Pedobacter sp. MC2016-24]
MDDLLDLKTKKVTENIRKTRESKRLTQEYLAGKLGISQNAYSKIELGYSQITVYRLFQITRALDVDVTELLSS